MPVLFASAFKGQHDYLAKKIILDGLWPKLQDAEILNDEQIQICRNEQRNPSEQQKILCMLEMLEKCDDNLFEPFCTALEALGQREVTEKLRDNVRKRVVPSPHPGSSPPKVPNITNYIKDAIDKGRTRSDNTNSSIASRLHRVLAEEVSFLHFIVFVYYDIKGFDYHCYSGSQQSVLHHDGRCAIVYYRYKPEQNGPRYGTEDCENVKSAMLSVSADSNAEQLHANVERALSTRLQMESDRDYWGLACISQAVPRGLSPIEWSSYVDLQYRLDPDIVYQFCLEKMGNYHCFIALC